MGARRRSPARKQHLGLPGGAAGAMDMYIAHEHSDTHHFWGIHTYLHRRREDS